MFPLHCRWVIPCFFVALLAPLFTDIDLSAARLFFDWGKSTGQHFYSNSFCDLIYRFGPWPGLFLFFAATAVWAASLFVSSLKGFRRAAGSLFLAMALGSGLIVHAILKDHWGRPRPKQVVEFGGSQTFRPFYKPNLFEQSEPSKSFPCGHCSTGFYFFSLALIFGRLKRRLLAWATFSAALAWGGLIGFVRMVQGGHFFSDVVMAGMVMWLTALACDRLFYGVDEEALDEGANQEAI